METFMPTSTFAHLLPLLDALSPQDIIKAQALLTRRREASESLCLMETAKEPICPSCAGHERQKWGRSRVGLQRYRCACGRTYTCRTNTPLAGFKHLPKVLSLLSDMMALRDGSCRSAAKRLGVERMTIWRWRMRMLHAMQTPGAKAFVGLVEMDETYQRESRKASREWANYQADPLTHKRPPRLRWADMRPGQRPRGLGRWHVPLLGVTSRGGGADLMPMANTAAATIANLVAGRLAADVALHTDGSLAMETFALREGFDHTACVRGYRPSKGQSAHLNTVNGLHALWRHFVARFRGPATRYLALYVKWFVAIRNQPFTAKEIFQKMSKA